MPTICRFLGRSAVACLLSALALAQVSAADEILANQNRIPAGKLENGVLNVQLELRTGAWRAEADDGPQLFVQAFGEAGRPAQIPGPLLRMPEGTTSHRTIEAWGADCAGAPASRRATERSFHCGPGRFCPSGPRIRYQCYDRGS